MTGGGVENANGGEGREASHRLSYKHNLSSASMLSLAGGTARDHIRRMETKPLNDMEARMRDEIDVRMWTAHHEDFARGMDGAIGALGGALRLGASRATGLSGQIVSLAAAFGVTVLTLGATAA